MHTTTLTERMDFLMWSTACTVPYMNCSNVLREYVLVSHGVSFFFFFFLTLDTEIKH